MAPRLHPIAAGKVPHMKSFLSMSAFVLAFAVPGVAAAQQSAPSSCPPGSWFCAEPPQQQPQPAGKAVQRLQPLAEEDEGAPPPVTYQPAPQTTPPPVVVYQPPPPTVIVRPETPPPYEYASPHREPISRAREWGLNLRLEGAMIGRGPHGDASMGGVGAGLRYKPTRTFGIEADLDFVGGRDYHGDSRTETGLTLNALVFLNPKSRAQLYLLGGFGWSRARVRGDASGNLETFAQLESTYSYFGAQAGGGLEIRLSRTFAFNVDLLGFVRGRTDALANRSPEFTDPVTGRTTNTSGGALLRGGMTLYF